MKAGGSRGVSWGPAVVSYDLASVKKSAVVKLSQVQLSSAGGSRES